MFTVTHVLDNDGTHRIQVTHDDPTEDGPLGNCDRLDFTFTDEGLVIDGVENGVVAGSECATFEEIVDRLE